MADLLIVWLQALDDTRDAKVVVPLGTVQRPGGKTVILHHNHQVGLIIQWITISSAFLTLGKDTVYIIKYSISFPELLTASHLLPSSVNRTCSGVI